jgi:hypothetical protein
VLQVLGLELVCLRHPELVVLVLVGLVEPVGLESVGLVLALRTWVEHLQDLVLQVLGLELVCLRRPELVVLVGLVVLVRVECIKCAHKTKAASLL